MPQPEWLETMRWTPCATELIAFLDAVYQVDQPRDVWIGHVLDAASVFDRGAGIAGVLYDISSGTTVRTDFMAGVRLPPGWLDAGIALHRSPDLAPHIIAGYRSQLCTTLSEQIDVPEIRDAVHRDYYARHAVRGQIAINGIDCTGKGCCLYLFAHRSLPLEPPARQLFKQIATHLATAYRLQQRVASAASPASSGVEAVLKPSGRIAEADGGARSRESRDVLERAVRDREAARGSRSSDPYFLASGWKGLVDARWTLVDAYERTGQRYILARENAPRPAGPSRLSPREQQVCALATLGRSNKLIAYELGLAHSTVRVLLARACAKLGVSSRAALIGRLRPADDE